MDNHFVKSVEHPNQCYLSIGGYTFIIVQTDRKEMEGIDGKTDHNKRTIYIANDLDKIASIITSRHEVIHALLGTQGRALIKTMSVEDVCEFIAYRLDEINEIMGCIESWLEETL